MRLRLFIEPQQGASYAQQLTVARAAEDGGFDAFFRSDHLLRMGGGDPSPGPTDSWVTLAGLARETRTIRLGTLMTSATFRLPGLLAVAVAQVDEMSGGRMELGLGTGWFRQEHESYGILFPPTGERFDRLAEQLAIVTGLWDTPAGNTFSYSGKHYTLTDSPALPKPTQYPHPPIIIGGVGASRTPQLAAAYADEFNVPFSSPDVTRAQFDRVRAACEAVDRDPATLVYSVAQLVLCDENEQALTRRAAMIGCDIDELRESGAAGTPAEVVESLRRFADLGAERAYLQILDLDEVDHIALLAREVLPQLC